MQSEPERQRGPTGATISTRPGDGRLRDLTLPLRQVNLGLDENQHPGVKLNRDAVGEVADRPAMSRNQLVPQTGPPSE